MDDVIFVHNRRDKGDSNRAYTQSDSPGGSIGGKVMTPTIALLMLLLLLLSNEDLARPCVLATTTSRHRLTLSQKMALLRSELNRLQPKSKRCLIQVSRANILEVCNKHLFIYLLIKAKVRWFYDIPSVYVCLPPSFCVFTASCLFVSSGTQKAMDEFSRNLQNR